MITAGKKTTGESVRRACPGKASAATAGGGARSPNMPITKLRGISRLRFRLMCRRKTHAMYDTIIHQRNGVRTLPGLGLNVKFSIQTLWFIVPFKTDVYVCVCVYETHAPKRILCSQLEETNRTQSGYDTVFRYGSQINSERYSSAPQPSVCTLESVDESVYEPAISAGFGFREEPGHGTSQRVRFLFVVLWSCKNSQKVFYALFFLISP